MTGLSLTTVSRTLEGRTLPLASQLARWATAFNLDHRVLLVESGLILEQREPCLMGRETAAAALSLEQAMNAWGITDPIIRRTLNGSIVHAIRLQREIDAAGDGQAVARG